MLGGTWLGYIYAFGACAIVLGLIVASTLVLYAVARVRERKAPRVRVVSVREGTDAA